MIKINKKENCSGCNACAAACPKNCIKMISDNEGFLYPSVDENICVKCGLCDKICPILNNKLNSSHSFESTAFAAINKDDEIREKSSSGGVFTLLAEEVLNRNGVVFGAAFVDNFEVGHICVDNLEDLAKLRGSKYVQSKIGNTYIQAKEYLENGREVLFSGTPCQIEGLLSFLNKTYDNLITQDIICHGVPSPMVWKKYVDNRTTLAGASVRRISFRHKNYGWKKYSLSFSFENDKEYLCQLGADPFMNIFLHDLCLRPSCYNCAFKYKYRKSDITLADFWGVQNIVPQMDDDKGTSLLIIHSNKGQILTDKIKEKMVIEEVDLDEAIEYNPAMVRSVAKSKRRIKFLKAIKINKDFETLEKKYTRATFLQKVRAFSSNIKRKIRSIFK